MTKIPHEPPNSFDDAVGRGRMNRTRELRVTGRDVEGRCCGKEEGGSVREEKASGPCVRRLRLGCWLSHLKKRSTPPGKVPCTSSCCRLSDRVIDDRLLIRFEAFDDHALSPLHNKSIIIPRAVSAFSLCSFPQLCSGIFICLFLAFLSTVYFRSASPEVVARKLAVLSRHVTFGRRCVPLFSMPLDHRDLDAAESIFATPKNPLYFTEYLHMHFLQSILLVL